MNGQMNKDELDIRGLVRFSLIDFPGKIAAVLFTGGCNLRCAFCHNPHLVLDPGSQPLIREHKVLTFLESRVGKLDGVVISGGEPTLQRGLHRFAQTVQQMGYAVKLDSNGTNPGVLESLYSDGLLQMLGIDYKAPAGEYCDVCGSHDPALAEKVRTSIGFALRNRIPLDVRTTVHRAILSPESLLRMRAELDEMGVKEWTLQQFNPVDVLEPGLEKTPTYSDSELVALARQAGYTRVKGLSGIFLNV